ncbi:hypothetical protein [Thermus hydrothermalis]|uniref:hypothetical protein n=1 Tax=Thermus hydrothermalis TaxID=2908148 RepID=UPI001FAA96CF|nr:hypothetical protein [Thermus hydrothermalis]
MRATGNLRDIPLLSEEAIAILDMLASKAPPTTTPDPKKYDRWWHRLLKRKK